MHFEREVPAITCNHIYTYIFYLQSVYLQDVLTVSSGPARLVTICPWSSSPPRGPEWRGVGHQLYVLKMTVSNKCLLTFFQGLCAAEFVVTRGWGPSRVGRHPHMVAPSDSGSRPRRPHGLMGLVVRAALRRARGAGPQTTAPGGLCGQPRPCARAESSKLHGCAPGLRRRLPLAPGSRRQACPASGKKRDSMRGPVGAAAERGLGVARGPRARCGRGQPT